MTLETIFYMVGIVFMVVALSIVVGLLVVVWMVKKRMKEFGEQLQQPRAVVSGVIKQLNRPYASKLMVLVPVVTMGIKLWDAVKGKKKG